MLQNIYARSGILYINTKIENKRVRLSTGLKDNALSVQFIMQNFELFLKDKTRALQKFYELYASPMAKLSNTKPPKPNQTNVISRLLEPKNEFERVLGNLFKEKQMLKMNTRNDYKNTFKDILDFIGLKKIENLSDFQRQNAYLSARAELCLHFTASKSKFVASR